MRKYLILLVLLFSSITFAQTPFIQMGMQGSANMGYKYPFMFIQPGVEYDGSKVTSINYFSYSPAVTKVGVQGFGYSIGGQSTNYFRISNLVSLGSGLGGGWEHTSAWSKSTLAVIAGGMFTIKSNSYAGTMQNQIARIFINYSQPVSDQNHSKSILGQAEIGSYRIRPLLSVGYDNYKEPSYCNKSCTNYNGAEFQVGVKIYLGKKGSF